MEHQEHQSTSFFSSFSIDHIVREMLLEHGLQAEQVGGRIAIVGSDHAMSSIVFVLGPGSSEKVQKVQLDVRLHLPDGRVLTESFAGVGSDQGEAVFDALRSFMQSSFDVLLAAFFHSPRDTTSQEWDVGRHRRTAFIGSAVFRGAPPLQGPAMAAWFDAFESLIKTSTLDEQTHWMRLYYAQHAGEMVICEALLDNDIWDEAQRKMAGFAWPSAQGFYSVRIFLVLCSAP